LKRTAHKSDLYRYWDFVTALKLPAGFVLAGEFYFKLTVICNQTNPDSFTNDKFTYTTVAKETRKPFDLEKIKSIYTFHEISESSLCKITEPLV
jgi:hypothetical protein